MTTTNTRPAPTVWATLQAQDAPGLIDFLVNQVGFIKTAAYSDGELIAHAQLDWPEGGGIMLGSHRPGQDWSRQPGTAGMYVVTDDPDALHQRLRANGVEMIRDIADQEYGNREFTIRDPEGNLWSFGYYRGEPRP